jgi:GT2 family glycosyltransferase
MLSVLIVNWNTRELLLACLDSLRRFPCSEEMEVIVVDNASSDGSAEAVRASNPEVTLVESGRNAGYAEGNNIAFSRARGDWLLTLNPDTEVLEGSLDHAIEFMRSHPQVGWLGVRLIDPKGQTQRSIRGFPTVRGILGALTSLAKQFPGSVWDDYQRNAFDYDQAQPAPQPMGTFLMFRRQALESVGDPAAPFDPLFPIFFNEVDLLYRLRQKGWEGWYIPHAPILHHGGESTKQVRKSMIWESHRSLVRYLWKHHGTGFSALGLPFVAAVVYVAAFLRAKGYDAGFRPRT